MKSAPSALLANIAQNVTSFATLVTLIKGDGTTINFTQHDTPITFNGVLFRNDIPYNLSAIDTNSDLSTDTTTLELAIDGVVFTKKDVANDLYRGGQIEIALVDWKNLDSGKMILRQGWFTQVQADRPNKLSFEIGGLLKVLDMGVGRLYQPTCDADLGDARCRVALDPAQIYSPFNPVVQGDWVYAYDTTLLTSAGGTNLSFESEDLSGWAASDGASWSVTSSVVLPAADGAFYVTGGVASAKEQFITQTFDIVAAGADTADIDAGKIAFIAFSLFRQLSTLDTTYPRLVLEQLDAAGEVIRTTDTRYLTLDAIEEWRERAQHTHLLPGCRSVRYYFYAKTKIGTVAQVALDRVTAYWYDVIATQPTHNLIFKAVRTPDLAGPSNVYGISNPGFENANATTDATENIVGWTKAGSFWGVTTGTLSGIGPPRDARFLVSGDDASGVQKTYTLTQAVVFNASWLDLTRLAQGKYLGKFSGVVVYGDVAASAAGFSLTFKKGDGTTISTVDVPLGTNASIATEPFSLDFTFPSGTASIVITLKATSPTGDSRAKIGFDGIRLDMFDSERPDVLKDLAVGQGSADSILDYTAGHYTQDNTVVWRAFSTWRLIDTVAGVTNNKLFSGTNIVGDFGAYETARIEWLSGNNAGRSGLIRTWFPPTKEIKTYFPQMEPIQVGDTFVYYPSCQKRFNEDCVFKFNNALNFRGIPHLPGALAPDDGSVIINDDAPPTVPPIMGFTTRTPTTAASGVVTYPTGLAEGDVIVVAAWNADAAVIPVAPSSDWELAGSYAKTSGSDNAAAAFFSKIATAADVADGGATFTNCDTNGCWAATPALPITTSVKAKIPLTEFSTSPSDTGISQIPALPTSVDAPGFIGVIAGGNAGTPVSILGTTTLTPTGQTGPVFVSYVNFLAAGVGQRSIDTSSVRAVVVFGSNFGRYAVPRLRANSTGELSIQLGVHVGFSGETS